MSHLTGRPSLIALGSVALLLVSSVVGHADGAATLILFMLVALAVVAING